MVNSVTLLGRAGSDPKILRFENGNSIAEFSLATSDSWKDKTTQEWREETQWHNIKIQNRGASAQVERAEKFIKKGMLIFIEGRIKYRSWDDKEGTKHYITEIAADRFLTLEKRDTDNTGTNTSAAPASQPDDDLPF